MLVLSRRAGESIVLPELQTTIVVVTVAGNRVKLGILAPSSVPVQRAEIVQRQTQLPLVTKAPEGSQRLNQHDGPMRYT